MKPFFLTFYFCSLAANKKETWRLRFRSPRLRWKLMDKDKQVQNMWNQIHRHTSAQNRLIQGGLVGFECQKVKLKYMQSVTGWLEAAGWWARGFWGKRCSFAGVLFVSTFTFIWNIPRGIKQLNWKSVCESRDRERNSSSSRASTASSSISAWKIFTKTFFPSKNLWKWHFYKNVDSSKMSFQNKLTFGLKSLLKFSLNFLNFTW